MPRPRNRPTGLMSVASRSESPRCLATSVMRLGRADDAHAVAEGEDEVVGGEEVDVASTHPGRGHVVLAREVEVAEVRPAIALFDTAMRR